MNVYFDGLKAVVQFTEKSCEQVLRLAENFNIRVAEKNGQVPPGDAKKNGSDGTSALSSELDPRKLSPMDLAKIFRAFMGKLLSVCVFVHPSIAGCACIPMQG